MLHHTNLNLEIFPDGSKNAIPADFTFVERNANEYMAISRDNKCVLNFQITHLNNCSIWHTRFLINEKLSLRVSGDIPCTFLWAGWKNDIHYTINRKIRKKMLNDYYNVYHISNIDWEIHFPEPGEHETFNVLIDNFELLDWGKREISPDLSRFLEKAKKNETVFLYPSHQRLTDELRQDISTLIRGPVDVTDRQHYFQQKVTDLFFGLLRKQALQKFAPKTTLRQTETARLYALRDNIVKNPGKTYHVRELARETGVNEKKLQEGFKQLFNNTVFGFIHEQRMRLAFDLLQEGNFSVKEVAAMTGYKNASNFSASFTVHFGYPPSQAART